MEKNNLFDKIPMTGVRNIIVVASGKGGVGMKLAQEYETRLLCQIPLVMEVGEAAEAGRNVFQQTDRVAVEAFEKLAGEVIQAIEVVSE